MTDQTQRTKQFYRSSGAILGLALGYGVMLLTGFTGMVASAVFWGIGCVLGGMAAERLFRWNNNQGR
jgi:short subunit fatty acids transporter